MTRAQTRALLRVLRFCLCLTLLFGADFTAAVAQDAAPPAPSRPAAATDTTTAPVRIEGRRVFEVSGSGASSATERVARINRRLQGLIERDEPVPPFTPQDIIEQNGDHIVTIGGAPIVTITRSDAADTLSSPRELALLHGSRLAAADARAGRASPLRGTGILIRHSFRDLVISTLSWLPRAAGALLLLFVFWGLARFSRWATRLAILRLNLDANLRQLINALVFYGIWIIGGFAILSTMGLESGSIATAIGISGFVLGFAFKDILSHFLAGLMLLIGGKFRIGDQIVVREFEGTVERSELRALQLRTYDNRVVVIPNADVFTSAVTSNTASPHRRRAFTVGIGYDDDIDRAQRVALETVCATPGVLEEPNPDVTVDELAPSTVNLRVRFSVNSLRADYVSVGGECMKRVKLAFDREGISMPTNIQTVVIKNLDERLARLEEILSAATENASDRHIEEHRAANRQANNNGARREG